MNNIDNNPPDSTAINPGAGNLLPSDKEEKPKRKKKQPVKGQSVTQNEIPEYDDYPNDRHAYLREKLKSFIRVGDDYFERIKKPDKRGVLVPEIVKRAKDTIRDDYGKEAIGFIAKYKAFCFVPSHINYQETVFDCFNQYQPFRWKPKEGECSASLEMLRHIFKDRFDVILDYMKLLYEQPTQNLPVLCLVSNERGTGKSTFGQWLCDIFGDNAVKLGNSDIGSDFNSTYAEKLVIVIDEAFIEKNVVSEAVKRMSTEKGKIIVNAKGVKQYAIDFIGKFIFISNNETNFIKIGKGEDRFFVVKVPVMENPNHKFDEQLRKEIPAFLKYLSDRAYKHKNVSRFYFHPALYHTDELERVINESASELEKALSYVLRETFLHNPTKGELYYSLKELDREVKQYYKYSEPLKLKRLLLDDWRVKPEPNRRYAYISLHDTETHSGEKVYHRTGTPYVFRIHDFFNEQEQAENIKSSVMLAGEEDRERIVYPTEKDTYKNLLNEPTKPPEF